MLSFNLDTEKYEAWLATRLDELHQNIQDAKRRITRRIKASHELSFPFQSPRPQQKELIDLIITQQSKKSPMLIQAPTGLGKTIGVLYPTLKESLGRGQKTIYVTPKNSQHQIALDTIERLQKKGPPFKSLVLTAKKKLCMKNEPICNAKYCEFAENHYSKVTEHELLKRVQRKKILACLVSKKWQKSIKSVPMSYKCKAFLFLM